VYSELLYSLVHNISHTDALSIDGVQEIFEFMRNAFELSDEQHQSILDSVKQLPVSYGTSSLGNVLIFVVFIAARCLARSESHRGAEFETERY